MAMSLVLLKALYISWGTPLIVDNAETCVKLRAVLVYSKLTELKKEFNPYIGVADKINDINII
jgi:hypothetical protein